LIEFTVKTGLIRSIRSADESVENKKEEQ